MNNEDFEIKEKGLEKISGKTKLPITLKGVDIPKKPKQNLKLNIEDTLPIIKKELEKNLLETLISGWNIKHSIGLILTLLSVFMLLIISKCS